MNKICVMVNGLPGNMAVGVATHVLRDDRFSLVPYSLTGPDIEATYHTVEEKEVRLIHENEREALLPKILAETGPFITVDYTHPSAVNGNGAFYCAHRLPFVMGTTGGDREKLIKTVTDAGLSAVIAPNMAKQIVGLQAMLEYAATTFPGLFSGYTLDVTESHQKGKADTSGTARAIIGDFNRMGIPFSEEEIRMERDPGRQKSEWGIPEEYLSGHAWHTYTLRSEDQTVLFSFTHNVNGREIYQKGTLDAVVFLAKNLRKRMPPASIP